MALASARAEASPASDALRDRAANELYNLDSDRAIESYRQAIAADANDAAAYRGLASSLWISLTFQRGNLTVDNYLGTLTRPKVKMPPPPPEIAASFNDAVERALDLARRRLAANPKDANAHYELGAAVGLRASYIATTEGGVVAAFRAAREAYEAHEKVLALDPGRHDAELIVGTYRYIVAALALPMRMMAYVAGFGGGKEKGLQMVGAAADYKGDNQTDARVALVLLDNREQRYDAALRQLSQLRSQYPRNRLFWLESGATCLRAGRAEDAERFLSEGMELLGDDRRPRFFGEEALWYYKRGAARAALGRAADAELDLGKSLTLEGRNWVKGRAHLERGRLALKSGNRRLAAVELRAAVRLSESDNDGAAADEARRLLK